MFLTIPLKYNNVPFFVNLFRWLISNNEFSLFFHFLSSSNSHLLQIKKQIFSFNLKFYIFTSAILRKVFFLNKTLDLFPGNFLVLFSNSFEYFCDFLYKNSFNFSIFLPFALLFKRKFIAINKQSLNKLFIFAKLLTKRFIFFLLYKTYLFIFKNSNKFFYSNLC